MSDTMTNRQRAIQIAQKGRPILSLEFDAFPDGEVSMWAHTRHDVPWQTMREAFEAIQQHLASFIADGEMCPYHPQFADIVPEAHRYNAPQPTEGA